MITRVTPSRLKNLMSLPRCPTLIHSTLVAILSMAGSVSSLIAATAISTPSARAPSSTRNGKRPLPAINPNLDCGSRPLFVDDCGLQAILTSQASLLDFVTHNRPRLRPPLDFFESRFDESRSQP